MNTSLNIYTDRENEVEYDMKYLISEWYDKTEVLSTMDTSKNQGISIKRVLSFIESTI